MTIPASTILFFSSESIVLFLLGSTIHGDEISELSSILRLFAIANMLTSISANLYYYQVALGNLKWHFISAVIHPIILLPILYFCIFEFGMIGAGYATLVTNLILFLFFIPIFLSHGFSKIFEWVRLIVILILMICIEAYCFNLLLDNMSYLSDNFILKIISNILNAIIIGPFCFLISCAGFKGLKNPLRVIKLELKKIQ